MINQIYFDKDELKHGEYYDLEDSIITMENREYELDEWIARGGNATVFKGADRRSGQVCAIKFLMHVGERNRKRFSREVSLLKGISEDHVTRYFGSGVVLGKYSRTNRIRKLPFLVMELAESNLQENISGKPVQYESYAGQFRGLARALANLHEEFNAVHRDIKPENILVLGERWLLSDYGLCTYVSKSRGKDITREGGNPGPKYWLSPEAHNRQLGCKDVVCKASDVYQLASIFWYVVNGRQPCGVVTRKDWKGPDKLFKCLHKSLYHDIAVRPKDGNEFLAEIEDALSQ